jgi:hypothetical protein
MHAWLEAGEVTHRSRIAIPAIHFAVFAVKNLKRHGMSWSFVCMQEKYDVLH